MSHLGHERKLANSMPCPVLDSDGHDAHAVAFLGPVLIKFAYLLFLQHRRSSGHCVKSEKGR